MKQIRIVLFMIAISNAVPSFSAEWVPVQDTQEWYLDKSSIRTDDSGNTWYWIKTVLPDNLIKASADISKRNGNPIDYSKYSYSLRYEGVNCKQGTSAISNGTNYDENGSVIESWKAEKMEFEPNTPDSIGDLVSKSVCNIVSRKNKSKTLTR